MMQAVETLLVRKLARIAPSECVIAAFETMARGVDRRTAFARTKAFYRYGGAAWARALS
jgi:hypothetical protein